MKFLAENPRTLELLDSVPLPESRTLVLSHFVWSAGQPIEATVKGLFCSLLHQVLSEPNACEAVLEKHPSTRSKDSVSDWSEEELQGVLFEVLSELDRPLCLFIDGLDEISSPAGQEQLLEFVNGLRRAQVIKTCVSSRPEPIFQQSLSQHPMFKVQDLTMFDIERFAAHAFKTAFEGSQLNFGGKDLEYNGELLRHVCQMADGVFLWVALAVRSLTTGLVKGDGPKELDRRLQALPRDLSALYNSMWDRLGEDKEIYQRDAARYFKLLLTHTYAFGPWEREQSLVIILLSFDRSFSQSTLKDYNDNGRPISSDTLSHQLKRQRIGLEARCAGLMEIQNTPFDANLNGWKVEDNRSGNANWYADKLYFIHRSAQDFILYQSGSTRLLGKDDSTPEMRLNSLGLAHLAACCLKGDVLSRPGVGLPLVIDLVSRILRTRSDGISPILRQLVTECGRLVGRTFRRYQQPRLHRCQHYDLGAILSWCLQIEHLRTPSLSIPSGLCGKYAAYLFIGALGRMERGYGPYFPMTIPEPKPLEPTPCLEADWLCEIAQVMDLGFQGVVCSRLYVWKRQRSTKKVNLASCSDRFSGPHTPLSVTMQCLQTWTWHYWWRWGGMGFLARDDRGVCILKILRNLLTGSSNQGYYLSYPVVIAIRTRWTLTFPKTLEMGFLENLTISSCHFVWELITDIEALEMNYGVQHFMKPLVVVKTDMRLAVGLLAADMRKWEQEAMCELLLHQLGEGTPPGIKATEILTLRKRGGPGHSGSALSTTSPRDLVRIEDIFKTYLESARTENLKTDAENCHSRNVLSRELYGLWQDISVPEEDEFKLEEWWDVSKRWGQDGTFWKMDDVRAQPPEGDVLGRLFSSWAVGSDLDEGDWDEVGSEEVTREA